MDPSHVRSHPGQMSVLFNAAIFASLQILVMDNYLFRPIINNCPVFKRAC